MQNHTKKVFNLDKTILGASYFTAIVFLLGLVVDAIVYFQQDAQFLFITNVCTLSFTISGTILLIVYKNKHYRLSLLLVILPVVINILLCISYRISTDSVDLFVFMREYYVLFGIIALSTFLLYERLIYLLSIVSNISFIVFSVIIDSPLLYDNLPLVLIIGVVFSYTLGVLVRLLIHLRRINEETSRKVLHLNEEVIKEKEKFKNTIAQLKQKLHQGDMDLTSNLNVLDKGLSSGVTDMIFDYVEQKSQSDEIYFNNILKDHPNLTMNELKLCFMISRAMSTKEIAEKTQRTYNSVKVIRSNLRKKLNIEQSVNLFSYLQKFNVE